MKRVKTSYLLGPVAVAVSALLLLTPGVAAAQAWTVVPSPTGGQLNGVASVSANDVWAVGQTLAPGTLAEHWDGTAWSVVPTPNPAANDRLSAVAAVSTSDVWAVGIVSFSSPPVILHWNGKRWASVAHPKQAGFLTGVTAVSANDVWAVGETGNGAQTLIEQWNGTSWTAVSSPSTGRLAGVAAVSASDIWAVGSVTDINGITSTVIEQWNGTSWTVVPSPNPSLNENVLAAASADPASTQAWAVGEFFNNTTSTRQTLTEFNP